MHCLSRHESCVRPEEKHKSPKKYSLAVVLKIAAFLFFCGIISLMRETRAEAIRQLSRDLDRIMIFPNGKEYYVYSSNTFFVKKKRGGADMRYLVEVDNDGNITSRRPFEILSD